jgi:hypothetical protein
MLTVTATTSAASLNAAAAKPTPRGLSFNQGTPAATTNGTTTGTTTFVAATTFAQPVLFGETEAVPGCDGVFSTIDKRNWTPATTPMETTKVRMRVPVWIYQR